MQKSPTIQLHNFFSSQHYAQILRQLPNHFTMVFGTIKICRDKFCHFIKPSYFASPPTDPRIGISQFGEESKIGAQLQLHRIIKMNFKLCPFFCAEDLYSLILSEFIRIWRRVGGWMDGWENFTPPFFVTSQQNQLALKTNSYKLGVFRLH